MPAIEKTVMLAAMRDQLVKLGYTGPLLKDDYDFRDFMAEDETATQTTQRVEIATFTQSPPSYRSACFGVITPDNDTPDEIVKCRALGALQIFALHPQQGYIERWKMTAAGEPERLGKIFYEEVPETFERHHAEWKQERTLNAQTLARADGEAQLDFFDFGYHPALEAILRPKLERDIQAIMRRCKDVYTEWNPVTPFEEVLSPVFRLVFRLIAAKMLIDRGDQPTWLEKDAPALIAAVDLFYFGGNTMEPILQDSRVQTAVWEKVKGGLDLQNLSVETLAYLYENAFVTPALQKSQSIHATPPEVAEYLLRQLPIEQLPESERRVFEPFTGSAPFLIAARRRLSGLLPKDISPIKRHEYLVDMLSGMENEPFAREIAKYALILADYPSGDSWRISDQDAFTGPDFEQRLQEANIILSNPPYGKFTPDEREAISASREKETNDTAYKPAFTKEAEALRRVVARHPAMLGFVLPRSFLSNKAFRQLRLDIAAHYSCISITVLPDKTFNKASQEVVLLAAHNVVQTGMPYSYAEVTSDGYGEFLRSGGPTWKDSYFSLVRQNNDVVLWHTPIQYVWDALKDNKKFSDYAEIHRGVEYKAGLLAECISAGPQEDFVPGIAIIRDYLESYVTRNYQYLSADTEKMDRKREGLEWDKHKLLVNRMLLSRDYWNISGAIDEEGLLASNQFYGVWPKADTPIELLAAIISGPVANAYLFGYPSKRENQIGWIKQVPVPPFTEKQMELIVWLVREYYSQRGQWLASEGLDADFEAKCLELLYWIDAAVLEAYALPAELERELLRQFAGVPRRPLPFDFPGYGVEYERAKEKLQQEKAYRATLNQYHTLVDKKYLDGLTKAEAEEMERLRQQIGAHNAPFYKPILADLRARTK